MGLAWLLHMSKLMEQTDLREEKELSDVLGKVSINLKWTSPYLGAIFGVQNWGGALWA